MRDTKSRWQHSTSTISTIVHEVIDSFMNIRGVVFEKPLTIQVFLLVLNFLHSLMTELVPSMAH